MSAPATAQVVLPTRELRDDILFFTKTLKMRLESIYPADDPAVATFSGHGLNVKIEKVQDKVQETGGQSPPSPYQPGKLAILCEHPESFTEDGRTKFTAPNGTMIEIAHPRGAFPCCPVPMPKVDHKQGFQKVRLHESGPWVIGRAGMQYRDLIPDRLGGAIIASHIRIPEGGPVPDNVHYHAVGFQLIFCVKGWVEVVYEDQGPPFRLCEGDCVIQPPEIRHRVLESSDGLEVVEIGVPATHMTTMDWDMELPTKRLKREREWHGQKFVRWEGGKIWESRGQGHLQNCSVAGLQYLDTGICEATKGVAGVRVLTAAPSVPGSGWRSENLCHNSDILFYFVMSGGMRVHAAGGHTERVDKGDSFVLPPGDRFQFGEVAAAESAEGAGGAGGEPLKLLEVSLPGECRVTRHV